MKLVSIAEYARLCGGLSRQGVYDRIESKLIKVSKRKDPTGKINTYIDIDKYPPVERRRRSKES